MYRQEVPAGCFQSPQSKDLHIETRQLRRAHGRNNLELSGIFHGTDVPWKMPKKDLAMATADANTAQRPIWAPSRNQEHRRKMREREYRLEKLEGCFSARNKLGVGELAPLLPRTLQNGKIMPTRKKG